MNNKDLIHLIRAQKPALPDALDARICDRLARLTKEEQAMKKRVKFHTVLIAAVVFVLLAGTAFALGRSNLMEYFSRGNLKPLDGAEKLIQTDFGEAVRQDDVIFQVEEAIFDGKTAVVQMLISPADPENVFLLHQGIQDTPEDVYEVSYNEDEYGGEYRTVTGRKDGKKIIAYSIALKMANENEQYVFKSSSLDGEELSDGSVRVWMEGRVISGAPDKMDVMIRSTYAPLEKMNDIENRFVFEKRITLESGREAAYTAFEIAENNMDARVEVLSAAVQMHALRGEMTVEYIYEEDRKSEPMGVTFKMYAGDKEIAVGGGEQTLLEIFADGRKRYQAVFEIEAFADFPEIITLEAKVVGQPRTLGQAALVASKSINAAENNVQTDIPGLYFAPEGSWSGASVTLLEGEIYSGRKIVLSYSYKGDRMKHLDVRFIAPDGTSVGEVETQTTVVKENGYTMTAMLTGSGWPTSMTVEFVLNGQVVDSFEALLYPMEK